MTEIDTSVPHSARIWNYWLGGKDNYPVDEEAGDAYTAVFPGIVTIARSSRAFLRRNITYLVSEAGIRQFLDIGPGLPTANNTHQVAQRIAPESRVVYTDNDPLVLVHARALLTSSAEGATAYIDADVRNPQAILKAAELTDTLDLAQPVAVMLIAVLHLVTDDDIAYPAIRAIVDAMPSGSYLVISHATGDFWPQEQVDAANATNRAHNVDFRFRTKSEVAGFLTGLNVIDPGIVPVAEWRAGQDSTIPPSAESNIWAVVAQK